jgi:hypothetical protein
MNPFRVENADIRVQQITEEMHFKLGYPPRIPPVASAPAVHQILIAVATRCVCDCNASRLKLQRVAPKTVTRCAGNCDALRRETSCVALGNGVHYTENRNLSHLQMNHRPNPEKIRKLRVLRRQKQFRFCDFRGLFQNLKIISWVNRAISWTLDTISWKTRFFLSIEKSFVYRFAGELMNK